MSTIKLKTSPVKMSNLVKIFPAHTGSDEHVAVDNIDLNIESGELVTLLGPSGCGKTTTLRMLAGFEIPSSGSIYIGDEDVTNVPANKRDVAMVFQSYALFPHLTIYENIAYGLKIKGVPKKEVIERVDRVMELMHLERFRDRQPSQLSGGQQQRVALARAVVTEPKVLLFDEPLSNLDAKLRVYMREELRKLQQRLNITSLYVTHDQTEAMAISDKVVIMNNGVIEQIGSPVEIYTKPVNQFVANFMGKANFLKATVKEINNEKIVLDFEGYTIEIANDHSHKWSEGSNVHGVSRPEFWYVSETGYYQGIIRRAIYFGNFVEYEVEIGNQRITFEDYNQSVNGIYQEGDSISLDLKENTINVLPVDVAYEEE
ncbi:ABC transporter ATP-binding protein [Alkalihalobacillus sp. MEB130]|uniref:ABC transporter ATP-binding protein n=1 Tax=Alkalihalobacillus sp. MEB130 TaxID=2976704 RepID=UPI0028E095E8|nr:ABC transporter ATP-binding protein [Alkalihalobacillus sp. MEB130]MDT8858941.1 ABC transporter ATP-binding protein [Alkalihalobacillus sp. MEB130]